MYPPLRVRRGDPGYPPELEEIADPPAQLWIRGSLGSTPRVAIVGSRACSGYGRRVATELGSALAGRGIAVVSGLAWGIDAAAHRGALEVDGVTLAVLPAGIEPVYPRRHYNLAARILGRGALLAEGEPGARVARWHFPRRNRLIAGLTDVTVVVEAALRSGARITADLALDYGRDVLVVPGPITSPTSAGCNDLLGQGAAPFTCVDDVLRLLPAPLPRATETAGRSTIPGLGADAARLLELLGTTGSRHAEGLAADLGRSTASVLSALTELELRGFVAVSPSGQVERIPTLTKHVRG